MFNTKITKMFVGTLLLLLPELTVLALKVSAVVIDFEDLPAGGNGQTGQVFVNNQYAVRGVTFNNPAAIDFSLGIAIPGFAHSGTKAIEQCFSAEFCRTPIEMRFTAAQTRLKVWVGFNGVGGPNRTVILRAFNTADQEVGRATATLFSSSQPIPIRTPLEVTSGTANISRAIVQLILPDGNPDFNNDLSVDDVEFDTVGPPPPCPASRIPTATLTQPGNGQTVQVNGFVLQGEITTDAPLEDARLTIVGSGGSRSMNLFGLAASGRFGPLSVFDELFPGANTLTVEARNCLGVGRSSSRTITFAPIISGTRFTLMGLEITQAIQDLPSIGFGVPLIADKRTFVRAYLRVDGPTTEIRNVSGALTSCRPDPIPRPFIECGEFPPIAPMETSRVLRSNNSITVNSSTDIAARRQNIGASLNFELPPNWTKEGLMHFNISQLQIEGGRSALPCDGCDNLQRDFPAPRFYEFITAPPVRLRLFSVPYIITPPGGTPTTFTPRNIDFNLLTSWLRRAYPSSIVNVTPTATTTTRAFSGVPGIDFTCDDVNGRLNEVRRTDVQGGGDRRRRYYGIVSDAGRFIQGKAAGIPSNVACGPAGPPAGGLIWDVDASYGDWYGGHELGHTYGRSHPGFNDAACFGPQNPDDRDYPFPQGFIGDPVHMDFFGFDLGDAGLMIGQQVYAPNVWTDVMTYRCNEWISSYTYISILNRLLEEEDPPLSVVANMTLSAAPFSSTRSIPSSVGTLGSGLSDNLFLQGEINLTRGSIELKPFLRLAGLEATPRPQTSAFTIALLDLAGKPLAIYPFQPQESTDTPPGEDRIALLDEVVPYVLGTAFIVISKEGRVLAERNVSPNVPTVKVIYPNGGEILQGERVTVTWQASDVDRDRLTYTLRYSADAGQTWQTVDVGIEELSYTVDLRALPGSDKALFQVIVTDGVNTNMDESDAVFRVSQKSPQSRIVSPNDGSVFSTAQTVVFVGEATDLEDGDLNGEAVQWISNKEGVLGVGRSIAVTSLMPDTHIVTLIAQDQSGAVGKASIEIEITARPLASIRGFTGDLDGDGDVDQNDLNIILAALNTPAGPGDPRDLNGDGKIDALDARILTTFCSRPRCAVK